jgi:hypothetical protein
MEIGTGIPGQDFLRHQVPDTAQISSVVAVSGADRSLVVFREGISQGASLAR